MFTAITLHGELGSYAGKAEWKLSVKSVGEALRAIEMNVRRKNRSIFRYLYEKDGGLAEYRIIIDGKDFESVEELATPLKHYKTIDIVPVPRGAGNAGLWEIIIGVVLIVVGVALIATGWGAAGGVGALGLSASFWAGVTSALILNGIALSIGGLVQLLNPPPAADSPTNKPSYLFGGVANSTTAGGPMPVGYGELIVGSQVISSFVTTVPFGSIIQNSGELQTNTGSFVNPASINDNVLALGGNALVPPGGDTP